MKKIAYVADSSLELTLDQEKEEDIHILRQHVLVENEEYVDQVSIDRKMIYEVQAQHKKMSTTAPVLGQAVFLFDSLLEEYESLLVFPIGKNLSGFYDVLVALVESEDKYRDRVFIVDSGHISFGTLSLIRDAKRLEKERGLSAKELKDLIEAESEFEIFLCPGSLTYLAMGGRINSMVAEIGNFLKIVPIISFGSQKLYILNKVRTLKKAYRVAVETLVDQVKGQDFSNYRWGMRIGNNSQDDVDLATKIFEEMVDEPLEIGYIQSTILTHTGSQAIGFYRVKKLM